MSKAGHKIPRCKVLRIVERKAETIYLNLGNMKKRFIVLVILGTALR